MPLNSLTHVNLLIFLSSCFPCQIHSCCSWMNTLMTWPFEQLPLANNAPSSWRNTLECQQHQTNCHLYVFHHIPTNDFILDVHLTTSWSSHWIASSPLPQQLCSYWKTVSPQWCCTFWSICHWSSFSSLWESLSCMLNPDVFPCTLLNPLWARTVTRHTRCLSDLGPSFTMLILIDHHWPTSCNPIWIPFVSIWLSKICIRSFSKWHSSHKVNQILQLYIPLLCYCTIRIWVNMLYLTGHLMNPSITINNH